MTIAQDFRNKINKALSLDEKIYIASQAREAAKIDFGNLVSKLKFSDNSVLEINTKCKAKIIK